MEYKDNFSAQASQYARFRPHYPQALYDYLLGLVGKKELLWDCATGNGQVAHQLAYHFEQVLATDASEAQIQHAFPHPTIEYKVAQAHQSGLPAQSTDLITVGQALHWFAHKDFYDEVARVGKPKSYFVAWGYGLCKIAPAIDNIITTLYTTILGKYWDTERHYIDDAYNTLPFPFKALPAPHFEMSIQYDLPTFKSYLATWSSWQKYQKTIGDSPLLDVENALQEAWGNEKKVKTVRFPIFMKVAQL